jgi:hypothetical protein
MLGMLSMLSWSKDPSWRREEKKEKDTDGWTDGTIGEHWSTWYTAQQLELTWYRRMNRLSLS